MCMGKKKSERNAIGKDPHSVSGHAPSEVNGNESGPVHILTYDLAKEKENEI